MANNSVSSVDTIFFFLMCIVFTRVAVSKTYPNWDPIEGTWPNWIPDDFWPRRWTESRTFTELVPDNIQIESRILHDFPSHFTCLQTSFKSYGIAAVVNNIMRKLRKVGPTQLSAAAIF